MVLAANHRSPIFYAGTLVWLGVCIVLIYHDFGVLAFCGSVMFAIWSFGLRDKFSGEETGSAYSVFNKDGKAIVGGFTASQFERQMRGGIGRDEDNSSNPVKGSVTVASATLVSTSGAQSKDERLRRRKAAAEAAERRLQQEGANA
jgi:hypothetical protein